MSIISKILYAAADTAATEKGRKALLTAIIAPLAIILIILVTFIGLISGLISLIQNSNLASHWNYVRASLSELFDSMESSINTDVKDEVYDFMPDFSVNLSKAVIGRCYDGSELVLYDQWEIERAQSTMEDYAAQLRQINSEADFEHYMADYPDVQLDYIDITKVEFTDDNGITHMDIYSADLQAFLRQQAAEKLSQYNYDCRDVTVDGKPAQTQILTVIDAAGNTRTVEYTCVGGGEIYIPQFLAMYNVYQMREFLQSNKYSGESFEAYFEEVMGRIPETAEAAEEYFEASWDSAINGRGAVNISAFEVADLCGIIEDANMDGAVKIDIQRTTDKLSIILETAGTDVWNDVFQITDDLLPYVEETQQAIELALDDANIPVADRTISLNNMVQAALFVYFEGFFQLPVSSAELAAGTNGILSQFGEESTLHIYNYGSIANKYGVGERGITLQLEHADTAIHADLLHYDDAIIISAYIYDVWDADAHKQDLANMPLAAENPANMLYNRSAVTIAYIIDTAAFERIYGFSFPSINGYSPDGDFVTLLLEFTCLDRLNDITELDKGYTLDEVFGTRDDVVVGYCHDGYYDSTFDKKNDSMAYYHDLSSDDCVPHVGIKTYFLAGASDPQKEGNSTSAYYGPTMMSNTSTTVMQVNPRLWFKGFRTTISEDLLATLDTIS